MSRKRKRPLPPRTMRMDRHGRLLSARPWLATQRGRPAVRIARSYRKRFGVDWACAIAELSALGISFDPKWREQLARALEGARQAKVRRKADKETAMPRTEFPKSDETCAFVAGYTDGGVAFGLTWEGWEGIERRASMEPPLKGDVAVQCDNESLPF